MYVPRIYGHPIWHSVPVFNTELLAPKSPGEIMTPGDKEICGLQVTATKGLEAQQMAQSPSTPSNKTVLPTRNRNRI